MEASLLEQRTTEGGLAVQQRSDQKQAEGLTGELQVLRNDQTLGVALVPLLLEEKPLCFLAVTHRKAGHVLLEPGKHSDNLCTYKHQVRVKLHEI